MATFPDSVRERLDATREVEIETSRADGSTRRVVIWIVVDGDDVFVRSVRGERGAWYRALLRRPAGVVHANGEAIEVTAEAARDPDSIERCSAAFRRKYPRARASLAAMLRPETLPTTMRLRPR